MEGETSCFLRLRLRKQDLPSQVPPEVLLGLFHSVDSYYVLSFSTAKASFKD